MGISGVFRACSTIAFCRFRRKAAFAFPLATAKALEALDKTSTATCSDKLAACSLGASSLTFCLFLCRWSIARIGRCLAGAFAKLLCWGAFFSVFSLSFLSRCRKSDIVNTSVQENLSQLGTN